MAKNTSKKISLTTGLNNEHDQTCSSTITNTTEDIFTKQQKLKVIFVLFIQYRKKSVMFRKKRKSLLYWVQKWLECKLNLNEKHLKEKDPHSMILYVFFFAMKYNYFLLFILKIGINVNVDKPLTIESLEEMNIGQLQAIINDLYCLIEGIYDY
jgi:hypothetical protein